jgi:hypothetical protein
MNDFASGRLIDAAATLDPADRALWNLWVNRGLDDAAVARMTGMSSETIAGRRARVVEHLGAVLDQPAQNVLTALTEIVPFHDVPPRVAPGTALANRSATGVSDLETESSSQRRRRVWMAFGEHNRASGPADGDAAGRSGARHRERRVDRKTPRAKARPER